MPAIKAIVPPETPGTASALPIQIPMMKVRRISRNPGNEPRSVGNSSVDLLFFMYSIRVYADEIADGFGRATPLLHARDASRSL